MNRALRKTILQYVLPVSIALSPGFAYSQRLLQSKLEESTDIFNNRDRDNVLNYLKTRLPFGVYDRIVSNYDSLVSRVNSFEDISDENTKRFEQQIRWFLGIERGVSYNFYITDNEDIGSRKLNMLLKLSYVPVDSNGVEVKYETMYIPVPK